MFKGLKLPRPRQYLVILGHFREKIEIFKICLPARRSYLSEGREGNFENFDFFPKLSQNDQFSARYLYLIIALKVRHFLRTIHIAITIDFIEDDTVSFIIIKFIADGGKEKK